MRKILLTAVFLACLGLPAQGWATPLPDSSAVDQYTEGVPTATGQRSSQDGGKLPPSTAGPLNSLGKNGAAAAAAAERTAPSHGDGEASQTSGLGIWLWFILAASLLAALMLFFGRRRTSSPAG